MCGVWSENSGMSEELRDSPAVGTAPTASTGGAVGSGTGFGQGQPADAVRSVGERLAQARAAKGWTIEEVSSRLKVSAAKLRALEAGDLTQMPDSTFAIGIVRSYAMMLGLDPVPLTRALRQAAGPAELDMSLPASSGGGLPRGRGAVPWDNGSRPRSWLWGLAIVVLIVAALLLWRNAQGPDSWLASLKERAAQVPGSASAAAASTAALAAGSDSSDGVASSSVASGAQVPMPRPATLGAGAGIDAVSSALAGTASMAPAPLQALAAAGANAPDSSAASTAGALGAGSAGLRFKMSQASWVGVRDSAGKQIFSGLVPAGGEQVVNGLPPFKITVGNRAGLASLEMNGTPVDGSKFPASRGNVARFELP